MNAEAWVIIGLALAACVACPAMFVAGAIFGRAMLIRQMADDAAEKLEQL